MNADKKRHIATVLVIGLLAGGVYFLQRKKPASDPQPQDCIYSMLDAARSGNVAGYLGSYTGEMAGALRQSVRETGEAAFAKYLRDTNASIKGLALQAPQAASGETVNVRVEYIYQDRNEAQTMVLQRDGGVWKIARVDGAERVKTLVPYGTPVQ
jgi:hypothetical protein